MFTKSTDMLNKNTLCVKKYEANKKQPYLFVTKTFDNKGGQVTKQIILVKKLLYFIEVV